MRKFCPSALLLSFFSAFALGASVKTPPPPTTCPETPVPAINSSAVPADVCIPGDFQGNPIQYFDDYSWKTFIAVVWPVLTGQRGVPDTSHTVADTGSRVFETYKANWEIFHNDGSTPAAWDVYDSPKYNSCGRTPAFGDLILTSFSKYSELGEAGFGSLVGPLVAQNTTYVRYSTGFNKIEFTPIVNQALYLRKSIPTAGVTFPNSSIDVKSAWMLMQNIPHPERYYTRTAYIQDPGTGACSTAEVGLVGLHIVQKTPTRPQWIWSTFEQVDNVPSTAGPIPPGAPARPIASATGIGGTTGTYNFNDGKGTAQPASNPYGLPVPLPTAAPYNVFRQTPINPSTLATDQSYLSLLQSAGGVWQYYQLVMTQWPTTPSDPTVPGDPGNTFPGTGATSAYANTTMESFDQTNINDGSGCMGCHSSVQTLPDIQNGTDFVWTINDHAAPANVPNLITHNPPLQRLQMQLMLGAAAARMAADPANAKTPASPK